MEGSKGSETVTMGEGSVAAALVRLGLPTLVGMMVSALYGVVDAYFVGGLGTGHVGAIAVFFPVAQVLVGLGLAFGVGAASPISRLLGGGDSKGADRFASTALLSGLLAGAVAVFFPFPPDASEPERRPLRGRAFPAPTFFPALRRA